MDNIADHENFEKTRKALYDQLMNVLREQDDPRVVETPCRFEQEPYASDTRPKS